ncbi:hypothetical protein [uncultured Fusobacterium sp.]|uniref:hypothetical protein n=1 Tax=uncultured Fusobacterium sp. TaxID=159267 RepID=UPI0025D8B87F|nr:hypothetical protein [uncultured Fusobacterium sp.]
MEQRILVSKRVILLVLGIGERQLSNLIRNNIIEKVGERFDLVITIRKYLEFKGANKNSEESSVISSNNLGIILGISDRTIRELAQKGIIVKESKGNYLKDESIKNYIEYLIEKLNKNSLGREEELRKKSADRRLKEIKLQKEAGELHKTETVKKCIGNMVTMFRAEMSALPSKLAGRVAIENDVKVVEEILKDGVFEALQTLAEWRLEADEG